MAADRQRIGNNVRSAREAARLNRPTVSVRCHIAEYESLYEQSLGRIERGERDITLGEAVVLADAIGCTLDELARGLPTDDEEHDDE